MNKCPKCKKELNKLVNIQELLISFDFYLEKKEVVYCNRKDDTANNNSYCCPECGRVIVRMEEDAIRFLKGE